MNWVRQIKRLTQPSNLYNLAWKGRGPVQTSNFTCADWEPNTYLGRPKPLSSTVDSDGRTLHVPNLIRG